jgi:hypothetical protein
MELIDKAPSTLAFFSAATISVTQIASHRCRVAAVELMCHFGYFVIKRSGAITFQLAFDSGDYTFRFVRKNNCAAFPIQFNSYRFALWDDEIKSVNTTKNLDAPQA